MALHFQTSARIEGGKLIVRNRRIFDSVIAAWPNCEALLTVEKAYATRSKAQNDFYWAVVVARIAKRWKKSPQETHEVLKAIHLPHDLAMKGLNGTLMQGYVIGGSTTKLNKLMFIEYLEAIVMWAAERDIVIPDPDPDWRAHAEEEQKRGTA
jgi:hypothetical protein